MVGRDWERFGEEIKRTIQDAVDSRDFGSLNQTINDTIQSAVGNIKEGMRNGGWYTKGNRGPGPFVYAPKEEAPPQEEREETGQVVAEKKLLYLKGTAPRVGGICLMATGYSLGAVSLILLLLLIGGAVLSGEWGLAVKAGLAGLALLVTGCGVMAGIGTGMVGKVNRFRAYIQALRGREYCDIKELVAKTGRSLKAVIKDLEDMIEKGWFCQGHLDEQKTCLMVSEEAYREYTGLMERLRQQKAEEELRRRRQAEQEKDLSPQVQEVIRTGEAYVTKIRQCNDAIPGEEISEKISRMEMLVARIFERVRQAPESVGDIRRLMDYYLPTTVKLLEAYEELDGQPVQGENILSSKLEIEKTLDTLNVAFEKLLDDLFQDTAWDVSADISVLHTMLAQEGLMEDEISRRKK